MRVFTKKLARVRDQAREVAEEFRQEASRIDEEDMIPPKLVERLWSAGFLNLLVPKRFGGAEASLTEAVVVVEELSRGSGAAGLFVMLQALGINALKDFLSEKKAGECFGRILEGRLHLAFALSEPLPTSGEKPTLTTARKVKTGYYLRGKKSFVSAGREADLIIVFALSSPRAGLKKALSAFLLPTGTPGLLPGRPQPRSGLRGVPAVELWLSGCQVGKDTLVGKPGQGYEIAQRALLQTAPLAAALANGLLAEALSYVLQSSKEMKEAHALSEFQPLGLALADLSAGLDSSLALTWAAAGALEENSPEAERLAREAKWLATERAVWGIDTVAQIFGIPASLRGALLERLSRDARACALLLGPNHLHRLEVARKLLRGVEK